VLDLLVARILFWEPCVFTNPISTLARQEHDFVEQELEFATLFATTSRSTSAATGSSPSFLPPLLLRLLLLLLLTPKRLRPLAKQLSHQHQPKRLLPHLQIHRLPRLRRRPPVPPELAQICTVVAILAAMMLSLDLFAFTSPNNSSALPEVTEIDSAPLEMEFAEQLATTSQCTSATTELLALILLRRQAEVWLQVVQTLSVVDQRAAMMRWLDLCVSTSPTSTLVPQEYDCAQLVTLNATSTATIRPCTTATMASSLNWDTKV